MNSWVKAIASFFYVGFLPKAPGTWGSLCGLFLAWFFNREQAWVFTVLSISGFFIATRAQEVWKNQDPKEFVLDEVVGMMLSVLWMPKRIVIFAAGFFLFRILDITKPWPISRIQKSKHSSSILWDDLAAGLLTNLILQLTLQLQS